MNWSRITRSGVAAQSEIHPKAAKLANPIASFRR